MGTQTQYVGEIHLFAGNFAPVGWAFCNGQLMQIIQNTALFSLLGTMYGGNGTSTFALPDLRGRAPMHTGQGPGLSFRQQGDPEGVESVILTTAQMPAHNHPIGASSAGGSSANPSGLGWAASGVTPAVKNYATPGNTGPLTTMAPGLLSSTGTGSAHNNMQPSLALNYIIALQGVFPPRN